MKFKFYFLSAIPLLLYGCAPMTWQKPNGTQEEFAQVRYDCLQKSQQQRSGSSYSNSGGYVSSMSSSQGSSYSGPVTNDALFGACMNAKGWYLQAQSTNVGNNYSPSAPPNPYTPVPPPSERLQCNDVGGGKIICK